MKSGFMVGSVCGTAIVVLCSISLLGTTERNLGGFQILAAILVCASFVAPYTLTSLLLARIGTVSYIRPLRGEFHSACLISLCCSGAMAIIVLATCCAKRSING
jgi:hypothetical protein